MLPKLRSLGVQPASVDGVIIDTGCSFFQWQDRERGFCHTRKGNLDLRIDADLRPDIPTASRVLQVTEERPLFKVLRDYSDMKGEQAKHVTNAIIEGRYMYHQFQTTQELYDVLTSAARSMSAKTGLDESDLALSMMRETVTALRMFVNDEINELDFAIRAIAENVLKPGGTLLAVLHTDPETKVAETLLWEPVVDGPTPKDQLWSMPSPMMKKGVAAAAAAAGEEELEAVAAEAVDEEPDWPIPLSRAEKTLHPRFPNARLYAATRSEANNRLFY
jgi:16S rRNA C1402 N4-methylase RsmH